MTAVVGMRLIEPNWPAPANVRAFTTTRAAPEFSEIDATVPDSVVIASLQQVHGTGVVDAGSSGQVMQADACFSQNALHACRIVTADCLPILVCNRTGTEVAAVHAGWRGLAAGVVENTLAQLRSAPQELLVWLGPAISQARFEVGEDVLNAFLQAAPTIQQQTRDCFHAVDGEKYMADLYSLARIRLKAAGIEQTYGAEYCTYSQPDLFYSYRRDGGSSRMSSIIYFS